MDFSHFMDSFLQGDALENYTNRDFVINHQRKAIAEREVMFQRQHQGNIIVNSTMSANPGRPPFSRPVWNEFLSTNRVKISDLQRHANNVLYGKFFLCRNIAQPFAMTSMMTIVEDPEADYAIRLALYNYTTCNRAEDLTKVLPVGTILVIKNPWFKSTMDGGYTLRCDNPGDVLVMEPGTFRHIFPKLSWKGHIPPEYASLQINVGLNSSGGQVADKSNLKKIGNEFFSRGKYFEALKSYNSCLSLVQNIAADDLDLLSNRAAVYLKLTWFSLALGDTEQILTHDACHIKGIFRKSKALCGLNKVTEALEFLKSSMSLFPKHSQKFNIVVSEIRKIDGMKNQLDGEYDMVTLLDKLLANERLDNMFEYKGPVEIVSIAGKGRGMVAVKDIKAGQLILASRAFEISFYQDKNEGKNEITIETNKRILHSAGHMNLYQSIIQRIAHDSKCIPELYNLYAGPEKGFLEIKNDGEYQVDLERIEAIVHYNAFEVGSQNPETQTFEKDFKSGAGLWLLPSYINHSCFDDNVTQELYGDFFLLRAAKDIHTGEEILIRYISVLEKFKARTKKCEKYGFECSCSLCTFNRSEPELNLNMVDDIMDKMRDLKEKPLWDVDDLNWVHESIATLEAIRTNEKLNLELAQSYGILAGYYFKNGYHKDCIDQLKKSYLIVDGTSLVQMTCTIVYNIVCTYLLQGGKQNVRRARQWTAKLINNFVTAHGNLDVLRKKKSWRSDQDFESLLKENGIHLL